MKKIQTTLKLILLLLISATSILASVTEKQKNPNVIVILTDDQGSIDLNCYGSTDLVTPNMDRLAKEGVRFTQFYSAASVCSPSRAALLTGKTNLRAGLWGNVPVPANADKLKKYGMPTEQITMAEILKTNGYFTALVGKWHLGHKPHTLPNGQGFDYYFGHHGGCIDNYSHFMFWSGPNMHDLYQNETEIQRPGEFFPDLMVSEIKDIIDKKHNEPFFIYWAFNAPHYPYQGEPKWLEHYKDLPTPRKEYAAFVSTEDERIGQVLDYLDKTGQAENTIVIFQSDHGHSTEERAFWGGGNAGKYRGSKFSYFEGGIRVPAIIRYPGVVPENQVRNQLCMEMDWFATIAELTGTDISKINIDGKSIMPVIESNSAKSPHDVVYWQHGSYDDNIAQWVVRQGDWKLIGNAKERKREGEIKEDKLFLSNLKMDISEKENLAEKYPKEVKKLKALHDKWIKGVKKEMGK
ncbi:MAG: sulfatase-like hydrolase/transferase [Draconibacterium sp.]|nr:sulfatase-like hydrolase/transferase [Draconibacterium sp.]